MKKKPEKETAENTVAQPSKAALEALVARKSKGSGVKTAAPRTVSEDDVIEALEQGDKKTIQAWIDEGGDLFADRVARSFPSAGARATRNGMALIVLSRRGFKSGASASSPWLPFLKKNEKKLRAMPGFDPNSASSRQAMVIAAATATAGTNKTSGKAGAAKVSPAIDGTKHTSLLHCAVEMGDAGMVEFLLDLGADPNLARASWRNLLSKGGGPAVPPLACVETHHETAFALLRRGALAQGGVWDTLNALNASLPSAKSLERAGVADPAPPSFGPVAPAPLPSSAIEAFFRNGWDKETLQEAVRLGADPLVGRENPDGSPVVRWALGNKNFATQIAWLREVGAQPEDFTRAVGGVEWLPRHQALCVLQERPMVVAEAKEAFGAELWEQSWSMPLWPVEDSSVIRAVESRQGTGLFRAWDMLQGRHGAENTPKFSAWEALCSLFEPRVLQDLKDNGPRWNARRVWPGHGISTSAAAIVFAGLQEWIDLRPARDGVALTTEFMSAAKLGGDVDWTAPVPRKAGERTRVLGEAVIDAHRNGGPHPMIRVAQALAAQKWAPDSLGDWEETFGDNPAGKAAFAGAFATAQAEMLQKMVNDAKNGRNSESAAEKTTTVGEIGAKKGGIAAVAVVEPRRKTRRM